MRIEVMRTDDYPEVYRLWAETPGMGLNSIDDSRTGIEKFLQRNPTSCLVARDEARVAGVILCGHDGRRGYLYHLAVSRSHRGLGLGRALVQKAVGALQAEGIAKLAFVVFEGNEEGNRFWEHLGFGRRTDLAYRDKVITGEELIRIDT
jgi:ribosomal protein S18 acetylase RimI-like enzyme